MNITTATTTALLPAERYGVIVTIDGATYGESGLSLAAARTLQTGYEASYRVPATIVPAW